MNSILRKSGVFVMAILMGAMICSVNATAGSIVPLYTTLGPGGAYDTNGGLYVDGTLYNGQAIGNEFTLSHNDILTVAVLALAYVQGNNSPVSVYIETNNGGVPGSIIAQLTQVGTISSNGSLVTFNCGGVQCNLPLGKGSYWLVAAELDPASQNGWFYGYGDPPGTLAYNFAASPTGPWSLNSSFPLEALQIDGIIPEPNILLVLGSGLFAAGYGLRRKLLV